MHVLTVLDHPNPASFSAAAAARFIAGVEAAGHTAELANLNAEGFDPRWTLADVEGSPQADLEAERARIARADALCLVFPLFWWGMPAMMKGWVDRVWGWGWAYDQLDDREQSLQPKRPGVLLIPAGARSDEMEAEGYAAALETSWMQGTFGYFGLAPRRIEFLCGSQGSAPRRAALLDRCYQTGMSLTQQPNGEALCPTP
ncbi:MAG: NAD(P)H-dependent oxidoreductase [Pseudomonadota bacterium]